MKPVLKILCGLGLLLTLAPSILFYFDAMSQETLKATMLAGMLVWATAAPLYARS